MDILNLASLPSTIVKFEKMLVRISLRFDRLDKRFTKLERVILTLDKKVVALGQACGTAFNQTKVVINKLKEYQEELGESLDSYGGVIEASSFDWS